MLAFFFPLLSLLFLLHPEDARRFTLVLLEKGIFGNEKNGTRSVSYRLMLISPGEKVVNGTFYGFADEET